MSYAGSPADEIVAFADQAGFDLVVAGTHGRSGVKRLMLGSVAGKLVAHARCPVLIARPRTADTEESTDVTQTASGP